MEPSEFGPEGIRALRGELSRAAFARRLGVTAHTVYRWELPDEAPEARRPRGEALVRLRELASSRNGGGSAEPQRPSARALAEEDDVVRVLPALDRVLNGDWRNGHAELVRLLTGDVALSPNARARACYGLAMVETLQNGDASRALLALTPCMKEADTEVLSPDAAARVFAVAALTHSLPSASVFDIGRVHAYAARAEGLARGEREVNFMAIAATIYAAILSGDRELALRGLARLKEGSWSNLPRLFTLIADEGTAFELLMSGKVLAHRGAVEALVERA